MQQLETDLNYISSLADQPAMTTQALKQEFDKAGNIIKDFINNILEVEITSDIASCLASAKAYTDTSIGAIDLDADNINYDNTTSGLTATNTQDAIDELKSNVDSTDDAVTDLLTNIGGITTTTVSVTATSIGAQSTKVTNKQSTIASSEGTYIPINAFLSAKTSGPTATNVIVNEINNIAQNSVTVQLVQSNNAGTTQTAPRRNSYNTLVKN